MYEEKITAVLSHIKLKPILPRLLSKFIDVVSKDFEEQCKDIIINMMDRIFIVLIPSLLKKNWILAIKINENINLFN